MQILHKAIIGDGFPARFFARYLGWQDFYHITSPFISRIDISRNHWSSGINGSASNWGGNLFFSRLEFGNGAVELQDLAIDYFKTLDVPCETYQTEFGAGLLLPKGTNLPRKGKLLPGTVELIEPYENGFKLYVGLQCYFVESLVIATGAQTKFQVADNCLISFNNFNETNDKIFELEHSDFDFGQFSNNIDSSNKSFVARYKLDNPSFQSFSEKRVLKLVHFLNRTVPLYRVSFVDFLSGFFIKTKLFGAKTTDKKFTYLKTSAVDASAQNTEKLLKDVTYLNRACHPELWQDKDVLDWMNLHNIQNDQLFAIERNNKYAPQRFGSVGTRIGRLIGGKLHD
jgi:hypothetical protein